MHVKRGVSKLRESPDFAGAAGEFQRAQMIDPFDPVADQELRRPSKCRGEETSHRCAAERPPIQTTSNWPHCRQKSNVSRLYQFEDVRGCEKGLRYDFGKLAGLTVIYDPDFPARRITVD